MARRRLARAAVSMRLWSSKHAVSPSAWRPIAVIELDLVEQHPARTDTLADSRWASRNWGYDDGVLCCWYVLLRVEDFEGADRPPRISQADGDARRGLQPFRPRGEYLGHFSSPSSSAMRIRHLGSAIDYRVKVRTFAIGSSREAGCATTLRRPSGSTP